VEGPRGVCAPLDDGILDGKDGIDRVFPAPE
jgi:hypothetical protein